MINLVRPTQIPESLQRPEIQQYLDDLQDYLDDIITDEPQKPGSYRNLDILDVFESSFHSKCYLTEQKYLDGADLEIDHFIPRNESPQLIYDWENLFPIAQKANKQRPRKTPEGGYLNPCSPSDDVEGEIIHMLLPDQETIHFKAKNPSNSKCLNTAHLLNRVHNGHDPDSERATRGLRKAIFKRHTEILREYVKLKNPLSDAEKYESELMLRGYFSKKSAFTSLMRQSDTGRRLSEFFPD